MWIFFFPGFAFYVVAEEEEGRALLESMKSLRPLIILMLLFVGISGVCFWLCENVSLDHDAKEVLWYTISLSSTHTILNNLNELCVTLFFIRTIL